MKKQAIGLLVFVSLVSASIASSQKSDPDVIAQLGQLIGQKVKALLPEAAKVTAPLSALRVGDALSVEERVRVRVRTDKRMVGAEINVTPGTVAGEVRLRGVVTDSEQATRAVKLAEGTVGVEKVINELAIPE